MYELWGDEARVALVVPDDHIIYVMANWDFLDQKHYNN